MEISNMYSLYPLLVQYQENDGVTQEKIFLVDFLREIVYSATTTHGTAVAIDGELSRAILSIVAEKKQAQAPSPVDTAKIFEPLEAKRRTAVKIISSQFPQPS